MSRNNFTTESKKLSSKLMVVSNINTLSISRATELEKQQAKMKQYSRRSNVEISSISNKLSDENLETKVIDICSKKRL